MDLMAALNASVKAAKESRGKEHDGQDATVHEMRPTKKNGGGRTAPAKKKAASSKSATAKNTTASASSRAKKSTGKKTAAKKRTAS
ncbi:hypothetical protein Smic_84390 [Streptomyces microflavus]|uniref:Uncharacterized protein n=1 Tax=Streptomyces microflavus TaxID=1919 RepID=A0A7J0D571_STRMI|nr:hypothetical protein Smic_84390 [Streptomyces microflavus]